MSILSDLASSEPARWALPFALFCSVLGAFKLIENQTSEAFKKDLSTFILSSKYESYLGRLPEIIEDSFNRSMGAKHLSARSFTRSFVFSIASSFFSISFSIIYNYHDVKTVVFNLPDKLQTFHDVLIKNPATVWLANFLLKLHHPGFLFVLIPILWIGWCFVPDFIALLKTRVIILVLKNSDAKSSSLFVVLFVDVIVTIFQFMVSTVFFQLIIGYAVYWYYNGGDFDIISASIIYGMTFTFEFVFLVFSGSVLFAIPFANVFWASALPSIWLWTYILSALTARLLISSKHMLEKTKYILDFSGKPISSLGVIAGLMLSACSCLFLIIVSVV